MEHPPSTSLSGVIERVTFHSPETGFCVLAVACARSRDLSIVTGKAAQVHAGEHIECQGQWIHHAQYGMQFQAQTLRTIPPTSPAGLIKYLSSGLIKGIGPHYAQKLIEAFGHKVFEVIEHQPERLQHISGIGPHKAQRIVSSWSDQKHIHRIMIFLQEHGLGTTRAVRIYKKYGEKSVEIVSENPYRLASDIRGIGFKSADLLAQSLGFSLHSPQRAAAGLLHVVHTLCEAGHCAIPKDMLLIKSAELLSIPLAILEPALAEELQSKRLIMEQIHDQYCLYPSSLYAAEKGAAARLTQLQKTAKPWGAINIPHLLPNIEQRLKITLAPSQKKALETIFAHKVTVLTGGPGVGKTTLIKTIITLLHTQHLRIECAAPTGRAAKRLSESCQRPAQTIHRLLEWNPQKGAFQHHEHAPLVLDFLIIDEASMIDIVLFFQLLKAIPLHAGLLIVGDPDQLPSVGPGSVLADLLKTQSIPAVRLTEIFRQAAQSHIIRNAHRVHQGKMPIAHLPGAEQDFYMMINEDPEDIQKTILDLVKNRLKKRFHCNPIQDIQILTPMKKGALGSFSLNVLLQKTLNGDSSPSISRYGWTFAPGDKIIQNVNNYDKEVFNGDIGFIESVDPIENTLSIRFDQGSILYEAHECDEISLAYAISIHKSQGSEFPIVIIPITMQHYALLARNLLYTGITRGRSLVLLIGQRKAISMAVHNYKDNERITYLTERCDSL